MALAASRPDRPAAFSGHPHGVLEFVLGHRHRVARCRAGNPPATVGGTEAATVSDGIYSMLVYLEIFVISWTSSKGRIFFGVI